jgi:hypothetical protein
MQFLNRWIIPDPNWRHLKTRSFSSWRYGSETQRAGKPQTVCPITKSRRPTSEARSIVVFWFVMPCALVGRYQRFGGTYCFNIQGSMFLRKGGICTQVHTALQHWSTSTSPPPWEPRISDRQAAWLKYICWLFECRANTYMLTGFINIYSLLWENFLWIFDWRCTEGDRERPKRYSSFYSFFYPGDFESEYFLHSSGFYSQIFRAACTYVFDSTSCILCVHKTKLYTVQQKGNEIEVKQEYAGWV